MDEYIVGDIVIYKHDYIVAEFYEVCNKYIHRSVIEEDYISYVLKSFDGRIYTVYIYSYYNANIIKLATEEELRNYNLIMDNLYG